MKFFIILVVTFVSHFAFAECDVTLKDSLNSLEARITSEKIGSNQYTISKNDESISVKIIKNKILFNDGELGVPQNLNVKEIMKRFNFRNHEQLTYTINGACSPLEASLIDFLVMEWFFFG